jgi:hypothetical protein
MQQTVDLIAALFNVHMKMFGLERLLNTMPIPPARQLTAGGASLEVSTPKVADGECLLIAKVTVDRVAGDHFTKLRSILRKSAVNDGIHMEVEIRSERLKRLEQQKYRPAGPHVMVTIDAQTDAGFCMAEEIAACGVRIPALKNTRWATTRWVMSNDAWISGKDGRTTMILTPAALPSFWNAIGYRPNGKPATVSKRNRRSMANAHTTFEGTILSEVQSCVYFEAGDGVMVEHPCSDVIYSVDSVIVNGTATTLRYPHSFVVGYVQMDGSITAKRILALTDGAHVVDSTKLNDILRLADPGLAPYYEGDGLRITLDATGHGQAKGHAVARYLAHRAMLALDTKTEFLRVDGRFSFAVMADLHRPKIARLDPQMTVNFQLAEGGFVEKYGLAWTDRINAKIGTPEALNKMFLSFLDFDSYADRLDDKEREKEATKRANASAWVLGANVALLTEHFYAVAPNGDCERVDYNLSDGTALNIWQINRLASRGFRHLTETLMDGQRGRIPVPETEALRAYAMFDITVMDHKSKKYAGKGFYLSNGVLKGSEGLVFHTLTADDRGTTTMVEGPACSHRQPSGWIGQMIRSLNLVHSARYAKMKRSPYLYLSCTRVTLSAELYKYMQALVGKDEMEAVISLWGWAVPHIVLANLIVGGGDLDDLHFVWIGREIVAYLRGQKTLVDSYPNEELNLKKAKAGVTAVSDGNRYAAQMKARVVAASMKYDRIGFYSELRRTAKGGLIAPMTNANLVWTERWNAGDPCSINMGGFNRHQEHIIDAEVKTGADIGGGQAKADALFKSLTRVSRFMAHRIPQRIRATLKNLEIVNGPLDAAYAAVARASADLREAFEAIYLPTENNLKIDYLVTCPVSLDGYGLGREIRARWNEVRESVKAQKENWLLGVEYDSVPASEKFAFAIAESVKVADQTISDEILEPLYASNRQLLLDAVIAIYKDIAVRGVVIDKVTHQARPVADAILYQSNFNKMLREAMRYAKCVAQFPRAFEMAAQMGTLAPELTIPGMAMVVVNGVEKKGAEEQERFITTAAQCARVLMHHLDKHVDGDMQELWAVCPALRNRSMDAVIVYQGGAHFGFIKKEQIALFKSAYGKDAIGTLARSVDSRTGAYNLYSAQVVINAA